MTLAAGMYGSVELNQKGLNQTLTIFAADGQKLRTADFANVGFAEEISLVAKDATTYRIEVKAAPKSPRTGTYAQAVALQRSVQNDRQLATTLRNFVVFRRDEGQIDKALEYLNEARTLSAKVGDQDTEASVLSEIARIEFARGDLLPARKLIEEAIARSESVRINLKNQSFRTSYLASVRKYYEFEIEVLMRLHQQGPNEGFDAAAI
jgi:tetratricopeptide (TPR) repeat protein